MTPVNLPVFGNMIVYKNGEFLVNNGGNSSITGTTFTCNVTKSTELVTLFRNVKHQCLGDYGQILKTKDPRIRRE